MHGHFGGSIGIGSMNEFRQREFTLIAVACAKWRSQMIGGNFLKALHIFTRGIRITLALIGARQAELRGGVLRSECQRSLKGRDGRIVSLELRIQESNEVICIRFVGRNFCNMLESRRFPLGSPTILPQASPRLYQA